ncbi:MAG: hypothetical protein J6Q52_03005 [Clostridia bacterium]|nr:hypothetical protein [Clostridia bacterium]
MKVSIDSNKKLNSKVLCEEYFSLQVDFGYELNKINSFFQINNGDSQSLEISVNENSELSKVILLCSEDFTIIEEKIDINNCIEGVISFSEFSNINSEMFNIEVYNNAIRLQLSSACEYKKYRQGNLILSLDEEGKVVSIMVINLKEKERHHIIEELQFSKEERLS